MQAIKPASYHDDCSCAQCVGWRWSEGCRQATMRAIAQSCVQSSNRADRTSIRLTGQRLDASIRSFNQG